MLTVFLIFFPLLVSVLLLILKPQRARIWALGASLLELIASIFVAVSFDTSGSFQYEINQPWITSLGLSFSVAMDGISLLLVLLTTVLVPFIILSSFKNEYDKPSTF